MPLVTQLDARIYTALLTRLKSMGGNYIIVEPGETYPASADTPFILVQDVRFDPVARYQGAQTVDEHRGMFSLAVMTPLAWTHTQSLGIAGLVRAHFPKTSKYGPIEILQTPSAGTAYRDGAFNRLPVSIRWRAAG
jgi:hypothetical protein